MLIPASYFFPDLGDETGSVKFRRLRECEWAALGDESSTRPVLGVHRAVASMAALVLGIVAYGGLMDLIL
jgi:hypothetical protein